MTLRIFLVTRGYPSPTYLYNYPFVHRRVLEYEALGHTVCVFVLSKQQSVTTRIYEGVTVFGGGHDVLLEKATEFEPDCVAAHSIADDFWPSLSRLPSSLPIYGWIHGAEILAYYRTTQRATEPDRMNRARKTFERRIRFWKSLFPAWPSNLHLVFLSQNAASEAFENIGCPLPDGAWSILPSPIDTNLFEYHAKSPEDRFRILSIRPFNDWRYGNDLSAKAIEVLSSYAIFPRFSFRFVGDGRLFEENLSPIARFDNVTLEKRFLTQQEIANYHREHGVFLVPTRDDAQGVSRDEAMSSGLVPVTNAVAAIPEFVDHDCGGLAGPNDAEGLAGQILAMANDPSLFLRRSKAAASRVRKRLAAAVIIPREIQLMGRKGGFGSTSPTLPAEGE